MENIVIKKHGKIYNKKLDFKCEICGCEWNIEAQFCDIIKYETKEGMFALCHCPECKILNCIDICVEKHD